MKGIEGQHLRRIDGGLGLAVGVQAIPGKIPRIDPVAFIKELLQCLGGRYIDINYRNGETAIQRGVRGWHGALHAGKTPFALAVQRVTDIRPVGHAETRRFSGLPQITDVPAESPVITLHAEITIPLYLIPKIIIYTIH